MASFYLAAPAAAAVAAANHYVKVHLGTFLICCSPTVGNKLVKVKEKYLHVKA